MVKRTEFEKELMKHIIPAIGHAQDVIEAKWGFRFEVNIDWHVTEGKFEDEKILGENNDT